MDTDETNAPERGLQAASTSERQPQLNAEPG